MSEKAERLVNLTVALLDARTPQTFAQLKRKLRAYEQDDGESARRMFERDKDALRSLGVPIETRELSGFSDEQGYVIDRSAYTMPAVDFSADEVAALSVALQVTGEQGARLGLTKLVTLAPDASDLGIPAAHVRVDTTALDGLSAAVVERRTVRFPYRRADGEVTQREVQPYGVAHRRGRWYLVGHDADRDDVRAFRVDRIAGTVTDVGSPGAYEIPEGFSAREHTNGPQVEPVTATIAFHPDVAWEATGRGGTLVEERADGWQVLEFADVQPWRTVTWVLGFGEQAVVLAPPEMRTAIVEHLERAVAGDA